MNNLKIAAKNTIVLIVSNIVSQIFGFLYLMYMARFLGAENFGVISFAFAITSIFGIILDFGMQQLTIREISRNKKLVNKYLSNIIVFKFIMSTVILIPSALLIIILGQFNETVVITYLIALYVILNSFISIIGSIFQAFERMEYVSIGSIVNNILLLLCVIYAIDNKFSITGFAAVFPLIGIIILLYNLLLFIVSFKPQIEFDPIFLKNIVKNAIPFALSGLFVAIYFNLSSILLLVMKGDEAVGWFNAPYRLVYTLLFIPSAFFSAIYPILSRSQRNHQKHQYAQTLRYMLTIALPLGIGITILANILILQIYGANYLPSVIVLQILVWSVVCSFLSYPHMYFLYSVNKQEIYTKIVSICVIINAILNILLIPNYGYIGASISMLATEFVGLSLLFIYINKSNTEFPISTKIVIKLIISVFIMGVFISIIDSRINVISIILLSITLYIILLLILHCFSEEDVAIAKALLVWRREKMVPEIDELE
jgi:O-antigen/teichoic acid export membrane protein